MRRSSGQEGGGFKGAPCTLACKYNSLLRHYQKELIVCATHHTPIYASPVYSSIYNTVHFEQSMSHRHYTKIGVSHTHDGDQTKCILTKPRRMLWKTFGETTRAVAKTEVVARSRPQPLSLPILRHHNNNVTRPQPFSGPTCRSSRPKTFWHPPLQVQEWDCPPIN